MSSPAMSVRLRVPRVAGTALRSARLSVVPRARVRAPRIPFVALITMVLLGGVVGLLLFNTSMQQASFAESAYAQEARDLAAQQQTLQMELDQLRDPQTIAEKAVRLGMVPAQSSAFIQLPSGKILGTAMPATRAGAFRINPPLPGKPKALVAPVHRVVVRVPAPTLTATTTTTPQKSATSGAGSPAKAPTAGTNKGKRRH